MSCYETPVRRLRVVRACSLCVLALGIGCLPLLIEPDESGCIFCFAIVAGCVGAGLVYLWLAQRTPPSETVTFFPDRAAPAEQARYHRRMLWVSAVGVPLLSFVTAYELHQLESGATDRVHIWASLALIYEHFGYWPTLISLPLLGVRCCAIFIGKLRKLNALPPGFKAGSGTDQADCFGGTR
jgi:hypothetical protein